MSENDKEHPDEEHHDEEHVEYYGDENILSYHGGPVPAWLKINYVFWIVWGFIWLGLYWNGEWGWLDRGYWQQLQRAANTTFPPINQYEINEPSEPQKVKPN